MLCQDAATAAPVLSVSWRNASVSPAWRGGKPNHVEREVQVTNFGLSSRNGLAHSSATSLMRFYTTGSSESAGLRSCFSTTARWHMGKIVEEYLFYDSATF